MFLEAACDHDAHCGALSPAHDLCVILLQLSTLISMMLSAHIRLLLCACVWERQSVWACVNATVVYSNNLSHFSCLESFTLAKAFYMSYVVFFLWFLIIHWFFTVHQLDKKINALCSKRPPDSSWHDGFCHICKVIRKGLTADCRTTAPPAHNNRLHTHPPVQSTAPFK